MGFLSMAGPCLELERKSLKHKLNHGGNPVLRWMADSVSVRSDPAGNKKPDKASSQGKIDGIVGIELNGELAFSTF
jgi:phage terminase large subunit-like protein